MIKVAIVGAGPAGIAAAGVLAAHGVAPVVIDEGRAPGRTDLPAAAAGLQLDIEALLGAEAANYRRIPCGLRAPARVASTTGRRRSPGAIEDRTPAYGPRGVADTVEFDALILATGATDRVLPIPGWTLPGVFTLGGAQVLLKEHGCLIGRRVVFCGSSPLLYLAAKQYRAMGAEIVAVLDTTPLRAPSSRPHPICWPRRHASRAGFGYMNALRRAGVPMHHGVQLARLRGRSAASKRSVSATATAQSMSLAVRCRRVSASGCKPETQLAELAGVRASLRSATFRQWLPHADADGRCGGSVYVAGDGATIGGAQAAALTGALAACAVLDDFEIAVTGIDRARLRRQVARLRRFQRGLARAFAWPARRRSTISTMASWSAAAKALRPASCAPSIRAEFGPAEVNRLKAITRCGMGRCQGRFCGLAAAELIAHALGVPLEAVGRLRAQAPVKPIPLAISPAGNAAAAARDETSAPA